MSIETVSTEPPIDITPRDWTEVLRILREQFSMLGRVLIKFVKAKLAQQGLFITEVLSDLGKQVGHQPVRLDVGALGQHA